MKLINLISGPASGKSVLAADLFSEMKKAGENVELITEYARVKVYEGHLNILEDQLYVLAKQNRAQHRLRGQVEWAITDSPVLLCAIYAAKIPGYYSKFLDMVLDVWRSYDNILLFIDRPPARYQEVGRYQSEEAACQIDLDIKKFLGEQAIPYMIARHWENPVTFSDIQAIF